MDAQLDSVEYALSPAKSRGLVIAALLIALLGLTTLDVGPSERSAKKHAGDARSIDCIVASAVFAGVNASAPASMH